MTFKNLTKMKNLFLLSTLLLLLSSCKFGSSMEAKEACSE